jgi:hypoxanthine phosphoribosyltransferase
MKTNTAINYKSIVRVPKGGLVDPDSTYVDPCLSDEKGRVESILIPEAGLRKRIDALGREIAKAYADRDDIILVVVLKGAFVFAADLGRAIYAAGGPEVKYDFIKASTYGSEIKDAHETSRIVAIDMEPSDVKGRDVLLVEDIVDQGFTLSRIRKYLEHTGAASTAICALLDKKLDNPTHEVRALKEKLTLDFTGFEVPDVWIAGYGVDAGEDFRFLPCIISVDEAYYRKDS